MVAVSLKKKKDKNKNDACKGGNEKNEETGSNTDSGNNHESTGVIEEIVTDAATGVKDAVTEAGTILEDAGRGVEDLFSGNAEEQMTDSTLEQTMPR